MSITKDLFGVPRAIPEAGSTTWESLSGTLVDVVEGVDVGLAKSGSNVVPRGKAVSTTVTEGATLVWTAAEHVISGSGGAVSLHGTTAIADGAVEGQRLRLRGGANAVTIHDGANTSLNGDIVLSQGEVLDLEWDGLNWRETSRSS